VSKKSRETMVRVGDWRLEVHVRGAALPEHTIDDHACVTTSPGDTFEIFASYEAQDVLHQEMFQVEMLIDGKVVAARRCIDGTRTTTNAGVECTFKGWEKSEAGQRSVRAFIFEKAQSRAGDDEDGDARPAAAANQWTHGRITLRVHAGQPFRIHQDTAPQSHKADLRKADAIDEKSMVKAGLSSSAGAGHVSFEQVPMWRAGETSVGQAPGDPIVVELSLYYRDSFFMLLQEDTCCDGACALRQASAAELRTAAGASSLGLKATNLRNSLIATKETKERLSRKRPANVAPIDLTGDD